MNENVPATQGQKGLMSPVSQTLSTAVEAADIQIPKILLMQGLSDFVADQKAAMGDFVDSLDGSKLGDSKSPVKVIPICMWKDFLITELQGKKFEFKEVKPYNTETQHWREFENREFTENGVPHQRNLRMNFGVILERDKSEVGALPYVISFQRTGIKAGKNFANIFLKAQMKGQKPWWFTLALGAKLEKNDKGTFYVPSLMSATPTQDFETVNETCAQWESIFLQGRANIDDRDATSDVTEAASQGQPQGGPETRF